MIIGDGPEQNAIREQIQKLHLEQAVHICGVRADMDDVYGHTHCLVIPSLTEGLPYVLLEAMGKKVPVIASAVGDIPLLITEGMTGHLVPPGDVQELARKMEAFLIDSSLAQKMTANAHRLVEEKYSAIRMAKQTEELYHQLTKTKWSPK
jgi:glycosyltransferase involved in cell wall biosynthesis